MTEKYFDELRYSEIKVDNQITLRQLMLDEADQLYRLVDNNREYLKEWLPWVEGTHISGDYLILNHEFMINYRKLLIS